jgi:hypothetical protein
MNAPMRLLIAVAAAVSLAACIGISTVPTPSETASADPPATTGPPPHTVDTDSPTPQASAVSEPTPRPRPTADAGAPPPPEIVLERLNDVLFNELPFNVVSDGSVRFDDGSSLAVHIEGDVEGADFAGGRFVDIVDHKTTIDEDVVQVDGVYYERFPDDEWHVGRPSDVSQPLNPFHMRDSTPAITDLSYEGVITRKGIPLHRIAISEWFEGPIDTFDIQDGEIVSAVLLAYVSNDGVPEQAEFDNVISGTGVDGQPIETTFKVVYQFRDVGVPVSIHAPSQDCVPI